MVTIRHERGGDAGQREALLTRAFGKTRKRKTSERLRQGRPPADGLAFSAVTNNGRFIGTIRLWDVIAGSAGPALLLGPVAVDCNHRGKGLGAALVRRALNEARARGAAAVILVGAVEFYGRFGFTTAATADLHLPGPVDRARFLGLELIPDALDGAEGLVVACARVAAPAAKAA